MSDIVFQGIDGKECESFIRAIAKMAFENHKDRDDDWMARFAGTCFDGDALRWYDALPEDTQASWKLLRTALLGHYLPESPLIPVPPAAPLPAQLALRTSTSSMTYPISGQLHISSSPSLQSIQSFASRRAFHNSKPVISADHWKDQGWAHGASPYTPTCLPDALGVQLLTPGAHSLHMIRLLNFLPYRATASQVCLLGLAWLDGLENLDVGSVSSASLVAVPENLPEEIWASHLGSGGPVLLDIWDVSQGGKLTAHWPRSDGSRQILEFVARPGPSQGGTLVYVASDRSACIANDSSMIRVAVHFRET